MELLLEFLYVSISMSLDTSLTCCLKAYLSQVLMAASSDAAVAQGFGPKLGDCPGRLSRKYCNNWSFLTISNNLPIFFACVQVSGKRERCRDDHRAALPCRHLRCSKASNPGSLVEQP